LVEEKVAPAEESGTAEKKQAEVENRARMLFVWAFICGVLLATLVGWVYWTQAASGVAPAIRQAWGPLLSGSDATIVHISAPLHLFVRPQETRVPQERPRIEQEDLQRWYRQFPQLPPAERLYVRPTPNAPLWGDAMALSIVGRVLERAGVSWEVMPGRVGAEPLLRNRKAVLLGRPEYSVIVGKALEKLPLTVEYNPELREYAVLEREGRKWFLPKYGANDYAEVVYGLITVMTSRGGGPGEQRTVVLTGTNSAGAQAAAEFWSSARELEGLAGRMGGKLPRSYQVLVRASASATMPLDLGYETHRVVEP
jgi:hypothetical protein